MILTAQESLYCEVLWHCLGVLALPGWQRNLTLNCVGLSIDLWQQYLPQDVNLSAADYDRE